jgi:hypothetical protein
MNRIEQLLANMRPGTAIWVRPQFQTLESLVIFNAQEVETVERTDGFFIEGRHRAWKGDRFYVDALLVRRLSDA